VTTEKKRGETSRKKRRAKLETLQPEGCFDEMIFCEGLGALTYSRNGISRLKNRPG